MTLAQQLADAQAAFHALQTGKLARAIVDQNGERVEFTSANAGRLAAYIADLQRQIAAKPSVNVVKFTASKFGD